MRTQAKSCVSCRSCLIHNPSNLILYGKCAAQQSAVGQTAVRAFGHSARFVKRLDGVYGYSTRF